MRLSLQPVQFFTVINVNISAPSAVILNNWLFSSLHLFFCLEANSVYISLDINATGFFKKIRERNEEHAHTHTRQQIDQVLPFLTFILSWFLALVLIIFYSDLINITTVARTALYLPVSLLLTKINLTVHFWLFHWSKIWRLKMRPFLLCRFQHGAVL